MNISHPKNDFEDNASFAQPDQASMPYFVVPKKFLLLVKLLSDYRLTASSSLEELNRTQLH